jgi:protein-L-isoaspartate(D-aspartate) O-methyltransferase
MDFDDSPADRRRRARMVRDQLGDIRDERVRAAMAAVPRHCFVPPGARAEAYGDHPLPIGCDQTISQPVVVAYMLEELRLEPGQSVLDVGSGCGYVAALLAHLVGPQGVVNAVERQHLLLEESRMRLARFTGHGDVAPVICRLADGAYGLAEHAPYDRIHVACACPAVPVDLLAQLAENGRMILPVGEVLGAQELVRIDKDAEGRDSRHLRWPVRFVPLREGTT